MSHKQKIFCERLDNEIGTFKIVNLKDEEWKDILGWIQESYAPIGLHVDAGFDVNNQVYKQSLIPLSSVGSTVIVPVAATLPQPPVKGTL